MEPKTVWATWILNHLIILMRRMFFILFLKLINFNWRLITLRYCVDFCHTLTWISHVCTCFPLPKSPCHLPPHPNPLGCPSALTLSALFHASNLDWWLVHIWYYTHFIAILSNHPTLSFSQRVQKSILFICVSFAVSHIGSLLTSF